MSISRREFLNMLAIASAAGVILPGCAGLTPRPRSKLPTDLYEIPAYGNVSLMHFTDCHAQLMPIWFREPNINLGVGSMRGNPPHLVGEYFLKHFGFDANSASAYAYTNLNFVEAARQYGKVGGFAHFATLIKKIRAQRPAAL